MFVLLGNKFFTFFKIMSNNNHPFISLCYTCMLLFVVEERCKQYNDGPTSVPVMEVL